MFFSVQTMETLPGLRINFDLQQLLASKAIRLDWPAGKTLGAAAWQT